MALAGAVDAIGPVQAGVEPLRRVRRDALGGEHVGKLVAEGERIFLGGEIAALPAPIGPGAGEAVEDLAGVGLGAVPLVLRQRGKRGLVGHGAPQEGGNGVLLDLLQAGGNAGLAEILLRQNVGGDLGELRGHVDIRQAEHDRAVGVLDLADRLAEFDLRIGRLAGLGETTFDPHVISPLSSLYVASLGWTATSILTRRASPHPRPEGRETQFSRFLLPSAEKAVPMMAIPATVPDQTRMVLSRNRPPRSAKLANHFI